MKFPQVFGAFRRDMHCVRSETYIHRAGIIDALMEGRLPVPWEQARGNESIIQLWITLTRTLCTHDFASTQAADCTCSRGVEIDLQHSYGLLWG